MRIFLDLPAIPGYSVSAIKGYVSRVMLRVISTDVLMHLMA